MRLGKKIPTAILAASILLFGFCKKQEEAPVAQIVGTKYSAWNQWIYKKPGTAEKTDQVSLVYGNEEVTGLELVNHESTDAKGNKTSAEYLKMKTVDGKEGFALAKNFFDDVIFIIAEGDSVYAKNSLTSPTKGKLEKGMSCFESEANGDFAKVRCSASILKGGKLNSFYEVWIQTSSPNLSRISSNPLLADSIRNLKTASDKILEAEKATEPAKQDELKKAAAAALKTVVEKGDQFQEDATNLATEHGLVLE
ncbi:lipoprotein LenA [Leptospira wolffii]|uniref:Lipoprotein LenA n=1 Tax=Leptospira wolffii TaxID=409998 RepID=A0ABV5BIE7_9LEPT